MILALDTATRWAGVALHDGTAVVAENSWRCLNNHTQEIAPTIQTMMRHVNITPDELSGVAVAIGPGSYTGLRVGLALAKGLSLTHGIPLLGIPTLDIVAGNFGSFDAQLVLAIEAGRNRMTVAGYALNKYGGWQVSWGPANGTWPELLNLVKRDAVFAGEITADAAKMIRQTNRKFRVAPPALCVRRPAVLAEIGWRRLRAGEQDAADSLTPHYMRDPAGNPLPPDA